MTASPSDVTLPCALCGQGMATDFYMVMVNRGAEGGAIYVCRECVGTRSLADVLAVTTRRNDQWQFEAQADRDVKELTHDPGGCTEWIEAKSRYCTRKAVRDGYCLQHAWTHGIGESR